MRVGVIGAGISGITCAKYLAEYGADVTVFEKSDIIGGRCCTEVLEGYVFDTGATSVALRGKLIDEEVLSLSEADGVCKIEKGTFAHAYGKVFPGDKQANNVPRYCFKQGMGALVGFIGKGIDIRLNTDIIDVNKNSDKKYVIEDDVFDYLVVATPIPEARRLLSSVGDHRSFSNAKYRACLSLCYGIECDLSHLPYHALINLDGRDPLSWVSIESNKTPERAPDGCSSIVVQVSPFYSFQKFSLSDDILLKDVWIMLKNLLDIDMDKYGVGLVRKWLWSQPEITISFSHVNRMSDTIFVATDALKAGRLEMAYECGYEVAQLIIKKEESE